MIASTTPGTHNPRISAQTVTNHLREIGERPPYIMYVLYAAFLFWPSIYILPICQFPVRVYWVRGITEMQVIENAMVESSCRLTTMQFTCQRPFHSMCASFQDYSCIQDFEADFP